MKIIEDRRALHRIPELDRELPKTMAYLTDVLSEFGCKLFSPIPGSLCAWFDFGVGHSLAFRSDADALPIQEKTGLAFSSEHAGCMHACGHDGHMAIALELARRLSCKKTMPHDILIVFQPAEETTGGARDICMTGVFEEYRVEAIFGLHLWPGIPEGEIASRTEEVMARSCEVDVDIVGRSSHIAKAEEGLDATVAAVLFYERAMTLEASLPASVFRLLKFGRFESGRVRNAISAHARIEGSLRAFQDEVFYSLQDSLRAIAAGVTDETGCKVSVYMSDGYPAVLNPEELCNRVRCAVSYTELAKPMMITEDFSWYQRFIPGAFFFLGAGDVPALHADDFHFNESILLKGADFFEQLAERFV